MAYKFLGARVLDFNGRDGNPVKGCQLWFLPDSTSSGVGLIPEKKFISLDSLSAFGGLETFAQFVDKPVSIDLDLRGHFRGMRLIK